MENKAKPKGISRDNRLAKKASQTTLLLLEMALFKFYNYNYSYNLRREMEELCINNDNY